MPYLDNSGFWLAKISLIFLSYLLPLLVVSPAMAQKVPLWLFRCADIKKIDTCHLEQNLYMNQKIDGVNKTVGRLLQALVAKRKTNSGKPSYEIQLWLPLGANLQSGAKVKVDGTNELSLKFMQCTQRGCLVAFSPNNKFITAMKRGKALKVFWVPFGTTQTVLANVQLTGFTKQLKKLK